MKTLIDRLDYQPKRHWAAAIPAIIGLAGTLISTFANKNKGGSTAASPTTAPTAAASPTASPMSGAPPATPGETGKDYINQENAYWNQLLQGTGQTISPGIEQNIQQQASLLPGAGQ